MVFTLPKPKSAPKTRRTLPDRKPDIDKLVRSTCDALTTAGVYEDDARIVSLTASKVFPGEGIDALDVPGCVIHLRAVAA
jgi:crossover junction endodeoxyribonuclease RusA